MFVDVERGRSMAVALPTELRKSDVHEVGLRKKGDVWHERRHVLGDGDLGFLQGRGPACNSYNKDKQLRASVRGDALAVLGSMPGLEWFAAGLRQRWTITERTPGSTQELRHLNRLISWTRQGVTWELDPRHVDLVTQGFEVTRKFTTHSFGAEMDDALLSEVASCSEH